MPRLDPRKADLIAVILCLYLLSCLAAWVGIRVIAPQLPQPTTTKQTYE